MVFPCILKYFFLLGQSMPSQVLKVLIDTFIYIIPSTIFTDDFTSNAAPLLGSRDAR